MMSTDMAEETIIFRITLLGLAINVILTMFKVIVGLMTGSLALIADALHSISDLATDGMTFVGLKLGARPPDATHPFGHGKFETIMALLIAGILVAGGAGIAGKAVQRFIQPHPAAPMGWSILVVAVISLFFKEWIYQKTKRVANESGSTMLRANAWHHRTDALSSLIVLLGAVSILCGWVYGDQAASLIVGFMVVYAGGEIAIKCLHELGEACVDPATRKRLAKIVKTQPGVVLWHRLRARRVGRGIHMDVHILVDPELSVIEGHRIAQQVEDAIRAQMKKTVNIVVHIEPNLPEEKTEKDIF